MNINVRCPCPFCGRISTVKAPASGLKKWEDGTLIQKALPGLTVDERELLINGICSKCYPTEPNKGE